ncbi:MAG: hypothetical protein FWJ93_09480 [Micromonosporaceae bacterium]
MIISGRYNGPPGSGNGGYTAGLVGSLLAPSPATVTLRRPPPLDVPLEVRRTDDEVRVLDAEGQLVAEAVRAAAPADPVAPVSAETARRAMDDYAGFADHPFPTCFVCGPKRAAGDGLRIFPGPVDGDRTAAVWQVPPDVSPPMMWAALDCPGGWAIISPGRPYVLGRMTAAVLALPPAGAECVVVGRADGTEGRKAYVRSSVYGPDGDLLAHAAATWIAIESG